MWDSPRKSPKRPAVHSWNHLDFLKNWICLAYFFKLYLLIFGHAGSWLPHRLFSSCGDQGLLSSCNVQPSHCGGLSCLRAQALRHAGFSSCGSQAPEQSRQLWCIDLVAPGHVGSSRIRDQTRVSCIGRQILYRWAQEKPPPGLLACQNKGRKGEPSVGSNPNCTTYHLCGCLIYMMIRWLRVTLRIHTCKTLASVLSN